MKEILDKVTSYNLFNYLLPGVLFAVILGKATSYTLVQNDIIIGAFVYYFAGLVISRVGSLAVEPLLKKINFLRFAPYSDFIKAENIDQKIESLSETNNMYRTFVAMFFVLLVAKGYELLSARYSFMHEHIVVILVIALFIMFLFSYRKQTSYVRTRVKKVIDSRKE